MDLKVARFFKYNGLPTRYLLISLNLLSLFSVSVILSKKLLLHSYCESIRHVSVSSLSGCYRYHCQ